MKEFLKKNWKIILEFIFIVVVFFTGWSFNEKINNINHDYSVFIDTVTKLEQQSNYFKGRDAERDKVFERFNFETKEIFREYSDLLREFKLENNRIGSLIQEIREDKQAVNRESDFAREINSELERRIDELAERLQGDDRIE